VILTGGYDGTAEELYFANCAAALAGGYNVLAFDGPGQGAALVQQGLVMRLRRILQMLARKPTAGWALRRGQLVHGVGSPMDYLRALRPYSLKDHASKNQYLHFTAAEGAGDHCEAGARTLYHARSFGWLGSILG
jgi:hypothetical protein